MLSIHIVCFGTSIPGARRLAHFDCLAEMFFPAPIGLLSWKVAVETVCSPSLVAVRDVEFFVPLTNLRTWIVLIPMTSMALKEAKILLTTLKLVPMMMPLDSKTLRNWLSRMPKQTQITSDNHSWQCQENPLCGLWSQHRAGWLTNNFSQQWRCWWWIERWPSHG